MNNFFKSMAQFIVHFPILIISTTILVLIFLGFGITRITMDSDLTDDIPSTIPEKAFYDEVGKIFPVDDALIIAITDEKGVYSPRSLAQVFEWTERIKSVEDVKSVLSLSNASLITGTEDGIVIENAMQFLPETPADIAAFRERMEGNEMGKTLIGRDGKASAMMIAISPEADTKNRPRYIVSSPKGTTEEDLVIIYQKILGLKNPEGIPLVNRIYSGKYEEDRFTAAGSYNEPIGIDEKGNIITLVTPAKNVDTEGLLKRITNITESSGSKVVFTNSQVSMYDRMNSVAAMLPQYTQGEIYISGSKAVSSVIGNLMIADLSLLFPIVICIIIVILFLSFRTLRGVLLPLTNVLMATIMAMGFMGWANQPISMATMILPIILIAVGTAYAIHVLNRYYEELAREKDKKKAIVSAIEHVAVPTILAALTTMIGFASLAISSITALKVYGLLAALGILFALILAVSFTPAILVLLKKPSPKTVENHKGSILSTILDSVGKIVSNNPRKVLITCLGIIIIAATGIPKINFESNSIESFKKGTEIRQSSEYLNENFTGITILNIIVQAREEGAILNPEILAAMDGLQTDLEKLRFTGKKILLPGEKGYDSAEDLIGGTQSITTFIRGINKTLHGDDPAWDKVPDAETPVPVTTEKYIYDNGILQEVDSEYLDVLETFTEGRDFTIIDNTILMERYGMQRLISLPEGTAVDLIPGRVYAGQLVFQYENSGDPENIESFIDNPRKTAQINVFIRTGSSTVSKQLESYIREYINSNFPDSPRADITGLSALNLTIMRLLTNTQISSVIASLLIILIMISLLSKSVVEGLFAIIPLSASLIINFGIMGLFGIPVDISTATIASIAIGIGIDYTLHFLERFKAMARTMELGKALQLTLKTTGRGIIYNATAVAGGFTALMFSQIKGNFYMGILMAIIMLVSSTFAIILLPAVLMIIKPKFILSNTTKESKKMKKIITVILILCASLGVQAQDLETILLKNENMPMPPATTAEMRMVITNKAGQSRTREIKAFTQSIEGEVSKQMLVFTAPADVRNTRFLTIDYNNPAETDEQAIYMPAMRKIRTIGTSGGDSKTGAFLGSDFTYADIGSLDSKLFNTRLMGQENIEGEECFKIEFTAKGPEAINNYGYSKVIRWISTYSMSTRQSEFYNKSGKLIKRMVVSGIELVDAKYWQFKKMQMFNLETGGNTLWEFIETENLSFIKDSYFTKRYLERGR